MEILHDVKMIFTFKTLLDTDDHEDIQLSDIWEVFPNADYDVDITYKPSKITEGE